MKNKEYVFKLLEEVEVIRNHYNAVLRAMDYTRTGVFINKTFNGDLLDALSSMELDIWRRAFMFGLTLKDEDRDRIKAAAYQRFLSGGLKEYLPGGINSATGWMQADEDEFHEMVRVAFTPKEKV